MQLSRSIIKLCVLLSVFSMAACQKRQPPMYHYNGYSEAYYDYKKNLSEESLLKLQVSMEEAIKASGESKSGRVPPGMYANVGYIYLKTKKYQKAIAAFTKEKNIYPESTHFMNRMIKKVELSEGENDA